MPTITTDRRTTRTHDRTRPLPIKAPSFPIQSLATRHKRRPRTTTLTGKSTPVPMSPTMDVPTPVTTEVQRGRRPTRIGQRAMHPSGQVPTPTMPMRKLPWHSTINIISDETTIYLIMPKATNASLFFLFVYRLLYIYQSDSVCVCSIVLLSIFPSYAFTRISSPSICLFSFSAVL